MRICAISFAIKKILKPAILKLLYRGMEKENLTETFSASLSLAALFMCSAVSSATSLLPLQQEGIVLSLLTRLAGWLSVTFLLTSQHQALLPFLLFQPPPSLTKPFLSAWSESALRSGLSCVRSLQYFIDYLCFVNIFFRLPIMFYLSSSIQSIARTMPTAGRRYFFSAPNHFPWLLVSLFLGLFWSCGQQFSVFFMGCL